MPYGLVISQKGNFIIRTRCDHHVGVTSIMNNAKKCQSCRILNQEGCRCLLGSMVHEISAVCMFTKKGEGILDISPQRDVL